MCYWLWLRLCEVLATQVRELSMYVFVLAARIYAVYVFALTKSCICKSKAYAGPLTARRLENS